jgi:hypothetical protein
VPLRPFKEPYRIVKDSSKIYQKLKEIKPLQPEPHHSDISEEDDREDNYDCIKKNSFFPMEIVESTPLESQYEHKRKIAKIEQHLQQELNVAKASSSNALNYSRD